MTSKISIITVNLNNAYGLEKTIRSVTEQTFRDFEFLVIDGASTDGSRDILGKYKDKIDVLISEPDTGIYNAMNKGIRQASGDYLLFLNSGDYLHDNMVLQSVALSIAGNKDIYYGNIIYEEPGKQQFRTFPPLLSFSFFIEHNISHQASFIKRELFQKFFLYNENFRIVSDWEFFIYTICKENVSYQHLDMIITNYDATGISSEINNHVSMHGERNLVLKRHFPAFYDDRETLTVLRSRRGRQFLKIRKHKVAWSLLKSMMSIITVFLPQEK
ncbi:glycosyltransferase family 2 protein [Pedobacter faecalis]|uniref:glycosyltransferase family 2 protein n=1 Tax=Pedobacter faecalis TaxID=3041495 RepID=UPI00254AB090|nr:glycosyltransferase family 2 protein [Pedobacter sp. ELA7]